jgi:hypothetical protein
MKKEEKIAQIKNFIGKTIDCEIIYKSLCEEGKWKYDTEESDILLCFMRTWKDESYIAKITLEDGVCAPPFGEEGEIAKITIGKFDKKEYIKIPKVSGDLKNDDPKYYLAKYGDPNYELELKNIPLKNVPDSIIDTLYDEIFSPLSESILE